MYQMQVLLEDYRVADQLNGYNFQEPEVEKIVELDVRSHKPRISTSSATSSLKQSNQLEILPFLLSPMAASSQKLLPETHDHPNASKKIKNRPPLPTFRTSSNNYNDTDIADNKYKLNRVHRSASTREFRKLNQNKNLEALCIDHQTVKVFLFFSVIIFYFHICFYTFFYPLQTV